jgi:hypothetical protein
MNLSKQFHNKFAEPRGFLSARRAAVLVTNYQNKSIFPYHRVPNREDFFAENFARQAKKVF